MNFILTISLIISLVFSMLISEPKSPSVQVASFNSTDATTAFRSFDAAFYSSRDKLYYSTTENKGIAAIWTQAIYRDIVMNAYQRTKDPAYLKLIDEIYEGGYTRYDGFNWDN